MIGDMAVVGLSWLGAYQIRFSSGLAVPQGVPDFEAYLFPLAVILPLWLLLFRSFGLYSPRRFGSLYRETQLVLQATGLGLLALLSLTFFFREFSYSRGVVLLFAAISASTAVGLRLGLRIALRKLRRRGFNLRFVVVVGSGGLSEQVIDRIHSHPESGVRILGTFSEAVVRSGRVRGVPVLGNYSAVQPYIAANRVDQVILAMGRDEGGLLEKLVGELDQEATNVMFVPDLMHIMTLKSSVEELEGLPVIHLSATPLVGWASVYKRALDLAVALPALALLLPFLAVVAGSIAMTSGFPVFYRQDRMGFDGRLFSMIKFRTMQRDAEIESGPVWATEGDLRRTPVGRFLRRLSLDELPQLWNVVRGQMSLVGPRPERPVFIEVFRRELPGYMLRHRIKAGMTGWAQVHGFRGDTSARDRLDHDLHYIRNWSIALDVRILAKTLRHVLVDRSGI